MYLWCRGCRGCWSSLPIWTALMTLLLNYFSPCITEYVIFGVPCVFVIMHFAFSIVMLILNLILYSVSTFWKAQINVLLLLLLSSHSLDASILTITLFMPDVQLIHSLHPPAVSMSQCQMSNSSTHNILSQTACINDRGPTDPIATGGSRLEV